MNARLDSTALRAGAGAPAPAPALAPCETGSGAGPAAQAEARRIGERACRESCGGRDGGGDLRCPLRALLGCF